MKEHPILFSGPMVRAILEGRKTQTRRVINPKPVWEEEPGPCKDGVTWAGRYRYEQWSGNPNEPPDFSVEWDLRKCPYGQPGDLLWVRETWAWLSWCIQGSYDFVPPEEPTYPPHFVKDGVRYAVQFKADYSEKTAWGMTGEPNWKPSIHMPRSASRLTLRITDIRIQRLQEITEEDAWAEGVTTTDRYKSGYEPGTCQMPRQAFSEFWGSINGKRAPWESNPWVWAISFEKA